MKSESSYSWIYSSAGFNLFWFII